MPRVVEVLNRRLTGDRRRRTLDVDAERLEIDLAAAIAVRHHICRQRVDPERVEDAVCVAAYEPRGVALIAGALGIATRSTHFERAGLRIGDAARAGAREEAGVPDDCADEVALH